MGHRGGKPLPPIVTQQAVLSSVRFQPIATPQKLTNTAICCFQIVPVRMSPSNPGAIKSTAPSRHGNVANHKVDLAVGDRGRRRITQGPRIERFTQIKEITQPDAFFIVPIHFVT